MDIQQRSQYGNTARLKIMVLVVLLMVLSKMTTMTKTMIAMMMMVTMKVMCGLWTSHKRYSRPHRQIEDEDVGGAPHGLVEDDDEDDQEVPDEPDDDHQGEDHRHLKYADPQNHKCASSHHNPQNPQDHKYKSSHHNGHHCDQSLQMLHPSLILNRDLSHIS